MIDGAALRAALVAWTEEPEGSLDRDDGAWYVMHMDGADLIRLRDILNEHVPKEEIAARLLS